MIAECPVVKLRKGANTRLDARADGRGPENAVFGGIASCGCVPSVEISGLVYQRPRRRKICRQNRVAGQVQPLFCGRPVFVRSSRGESELKVKRATPVIRRESVCRASAAAGRACATGMHLKRPRRKVAAPLVREASMRAASGNSLPAGKPRSRLLHEGMHVWPYLRRGSSELETRTTG